MPSTDTPSPHPLLRENLLPHGLSDADWLKSLTFRDGGFPQLAAAAEQGNVTDFVATLLKAYEHQCHLGKRERARMLSTLEVLWSRIDDRKSALQEEGSLARCLFDQELTSDELSGRLETIMAGDAGDPADPAALLAAGWLIRLRGKQLEPHTFLTLLRWILLRSSSGSIAGENDSPDESPKNASDATFEDLERQLISFGILPGRKKEKKDWQELADGWRTALDSATDTDGTPHSRWLPHLLSKCCQLAGVRLFADSLNLPLWNRKEQKRLQGLFLRTVLLWTPRQMSLGEASPDAAATALLTVADVLHLEHVTGLLTQLKQAQSTRSGARHRKLHGKFPKSNAQSDWGEWACLRSGWEGAIDQCIVRYHTPTPQLDVVASDVPFLSGAWEHTLTVDGRPVPTTGEWSCCCWYEDRKATFLELQLDRDNSLQQIRQVLLLREESVLMIADSIRLPSAGKIEFQRRLPLTREWSVEEDTLSREAALCQGNQRIRVFPWTSPQMRLDRSDETLTVTRNEVRVDVQTQGNCLYVSTLFDWSEKRREAPVDWRRITVAEDGRIIAADLAVGYRLRLGKKQWVLYHSHRPPHFPRSVLGIHTLSETVFARLNGRGDADALVEVEL